MRCEVRAAPVKRVGMLGINGRKLSNTELVERLRVAEADATETLINTAEEVVQGALWSVVRRVECQGRLSARDLDLSHHPGAMTDCFGRHGYSECPSRFSFE